MAQSKKHKSRRVVVVKGARVINTGAGGGEKKGRTLSLEGAQTRRRMMLESQHLSREDKKGEDARIARVKAITKRVHKGGGLTILKPKNGG